MAVEIEKIEGVENRLTRRPLATAAAKSLLQRAEIRSPLPVQHNGFAVKNECRCPQTPSGRGNCRKAMGPVMAAARDDADHTGFDVYCQAISMPLDFESPLGPDGRLCLQERQTGLDALRHRIKRELRLLRVTTFAR